MQIDSTSGEITWTPSEIGQVSIEVFAENSAGRGISTLTIDVVGSPLLSAIDTTDFAIGQGTGSAWTAQTSVTFDGIDAIQSASTSDSGSSEFVLEIDGAGILEFYWRVSSEDGFDFLSFSADGEILDQISGETDWERFAIRLSSGSHRFVWKYEKDFELSGGSDRGWIDSVRFVTDENELIMLRIADARIPSGSPYAQRVEFTPSTASLALDGLPAWLSIDDQGYLTGTPPAGSSGTSEITLTATQAGAASASSFNITNEPTLNFAAAVGSGNAVTFFDESGDSPWRAVTSSGSESGPASLRSGVLRDDEFSSLSAVVRGPATLSFAWRVDSEEFFDRFFLFFDGTYVSDISGDVPWETLTLPIPNGVHQLQWTYT